jgi:hypothetical protein
MNVLCVLVQYKLDFSEAVFRWNPGQPLAEEVNLQSHFQEPGQESYIRENLAAAFMKDIGVPTSTVTHVRIKQV